MNLEMCLNETFEFIKCLKKCYPNVYEMINEYIFNACKITQHMSQEKAKRRAIDQGALECYMDPVSVIGAKKNSNLSDSIRNNDNKPDKANLNYNKKRFQPKQTAAGRQIQREENKRRKQFERERAAARKAQQQRNKTKQKKKGSKD